MNIIGIIAFLVIVERKSIFKCKFLYIIYIMQKRKINKNTKRKINRNTKRNYTKKRKTIKKLGGGSLPPFVNPLNEKAEKLLEGVTFIELGHTMENIYNTGFTKDEKDSLREYQEQSILINGFIRDGFDYYTNKSARNSSFYEFMEDITNKSENTLDDIKNIDNLFLKKCPRLKTKTALFRGTDKFYPEGTAFTSTTKNFETLLEILKKDPKFVDDKKKCCFNILIVDEGIPYLDLEIAGSEWSFQKEILLPRDLKFTVIDENELLYKGANYKVYIYRVSLYDAGEFSISDDLYQELNIENKDLFVTRKDVTFLLETQEKEFSKIATFIKKEADPDKEDELLDTLSVLQDNLKDYLMKKIIFLCTKKTYWKICKEFLEQSNDIVKFMTDNDLVDPKYTDKIESIRKKIENMKTELQNGSLIINKNNYIQV